jgi:hypothetical protein
MSLQKRQEPVDGEEVRFLEVRAQGDDIFGAHSVGFRFALPEAGTYGVSLEAIGGPDQAIVQVVRNEKAEGMPVDLYRPRRERTGPLPLGELAFVEGENVVLLELTGRNARSTGLGLDLAGVVFERID